MAPSQPGRGPYLILASGPDAAVLYGRATTAQRTTFARVGWIDHVTGRMRTIGSTEFWGGGGGGSGWGDESAARRRDMLGESMLAQHMGDGSNGAELWKLDVASGGWAPVASTIAGPIGGEPRLVTSADGFACYVSHDSSLRERGWRTDGTASGTSAVLPYGSEWSIVRLGASVIVQGYVLDESRTGVWRIGDAASGPAESLVSLPGAFPSSMVETGAWVEFATSHPATGTAVWRTDGTAQGTRQLGSIPGSAVLLAASEDERSPRFLNAYVDGGLHELWSFTPGGGAVRLAGPFASIDSSALAGAKLVFSATTTGDPAVREPWVSDGTVSGTRRVSAAGVGGLSGARVWCAAGSFAYITASEPGTGSEMWRTDGTASGTRRMTDIAAGPASSNPHGAVIVNNRLYFAATDGSNTEDLWQIDLCPADFNNNHVLSVQDIFDFLTAYFAGDPRANVGGVDQVSVQDLMDWLAMWFGGCG